MRPLPFVVFLFVAVLLLALACESGGDGTPSGGATSPTAGATIPPADVAALKEYFLAIETISKEDRERGTALRAELEAALSAATTEDEKIKALRGRIEGTATILEDDLDGVNNIDPPAGAKDAHNSFVNALAEQLAVFRLLLDASTGAQSVTEWDAVSAQFASAATEADEGVLDACSELQDIADSSGIDVDLGCE